jgi:hypothetical protein
MHDKKTKAQSFVEFALVLPIIILILLGVVELTLFIGSYINLVDLTREAARFASNRDPFTNTGADSNCSTLEPVNFFYDTACIFSPLQGSACTDTNFCNGFNSTLSLKSTEDDILVNVFTETGETGVSRAITNNALTSQMPWVWSNHDGDTSHNDNWRRDCNRLTTPQTLTPYFTQTSMTTYLNGTAMPNKGFVTVEVYYCYHQVLNIPFLAQFLPNPIQVHTYTVMPLPYAQPTPTPRP